MTSPAVEFSSRSPVHSVRKLRHCIEQVAESAGFDIRNATIEQLLVFLTVADRILLEGNTTQRDIARERGRAKSSMQRNVKWLTETNAHKEPGLGLVEEFTDHTNLRLKPIRLTDRGLRAVLCVHEQLSGGGVSK